MPASELFSVLGVEQESNIQQARDHCGESPRPGDGMSIDSKSHESPLIKSKVINSGGTVIVITESDQQQRSVVGHSVLSMAQIEPSGSYVNEASYGTETSNIGSEHRDFQVERRSDDDDNVDTDDRPMENLDYQLQTTRSSLLVNPKPSGDFSPVNTRAATSPHQTYKISNVQNFNSHEPGVKGKIAMQINVTTERNNNSLGSRQMINSVHSSESNGEQIESLVLDTASNVGARYDSIIFQKSQDFGRLSTDEEYMMHNRAKGKVH